MGGTQSVYCNDIAKDIWSWAEERNILLSAAYICTKANIVADLYSRKFKENTEWSLDKDIFQQIVDKYFLPDIDLFATYVNRQVDKYSSWHNGVDTYAVDALT